MDRGYDVSAVHRGLELLGVKGFIPPVNFPIVQKKVAFNMFLKRMSLSAQKGIA